EVAGGIVEQAGERPVLVPDALHHRVHGCGIADVDGVRAHTATVLGHQFAGGVFQYAAAAGGEPQIGAEREVLRGDFSSEAGAAAGDEDALTFEQALLEHARSAD